MCIPIKKSLPFPHNPFPLTTTNLLFVAMDLSFLIFHFSGHLHFSFMLQVGADHLFVAAEDLNMVQVVRKKRKKKVAFTDDQP